jgi:L-asparaginase II
MKEILCEFRRAGRVESVHRVRAAVLVDGRAALASGETAAPVFLRSCAKPFQAWAVVETGAADAYGLEAPELAVMAGSHGGEASHVRAVRSILRKARVPVRALRCGSHPPLSARGLRELYGAGREPTPLHNNCSGKHAGMLAAARRLGAPLEGYLDPDHPVQRANLRAVARFTGVAARAIRIGIDGCSAPTFAVPLRALARAGAEFAGAADPSARRVREAMAAHPDRVGRPCALLLSAAPGRILAKGGAEGVYLCAVPARRAGIALKIVDGNVRPVVHVLAALFRKLGLLEGEDLARVAKAADPVLRNHAGLAVGEVRVRL